MDEKKPRKLHVTIGEDEEHPLLDLVSWLPSHAVYQLMEQFGLPLQVFEPPRAVARPSMVSRVSCQHRQECIDSSDKCGECAHNEVKSYFKPKEKESQFPSPNKPKCKNCGKPISQDFIISRFNDGLSLVCPWCGEELYEKKEGAD